SWKKARLPPPARVRARSRGMASAVVGRAWWVRILGHADRSLPFAPLRLSLARGQWTGARPASRDHPTGRRRPEHGRADPAGWTLRPLSALRGHALPGAAARHCLPTTLRSGRPNHPRARPRTLPPEAVSGTGGPARHSGGAAPKRGTLRRKGPGGSR